MSNTTFPGFPVECPSRNRVRRRVLRQLYHALHWMAIPGFGFDVKAIFDDLRKRQAMLGNRLVSRKKHAETGDVISSAPRETSGSAPASPGI